MIKQIRKPDAAPLAVGSVAQLPSGGSRMTVVKLQGEQANVVWLDKDGHFQQAALPLAALLPAEPAGR